MSRGSSSRPAACPRRCTTTASCSRTSGGLDLLCLDIEQGEPAALAGFDIARFRPALVCVEVGTPLVRDSVIPYFAEHAYERIDEYLAYDWVNWYYAPGGA